MLQQRMRKTQFYPLYLVIFFGYFGYALALTIFTPMFLHLKGGLLPAETSPASRVLILGIVLTLYPLGQFLGSPIMGSLSDRLGRRPVLIVTLIITTICYALIAISLEVQHLLLLCIALLVGGFSESNVVTAQSAVVDVTEPAERPVQFGYIYAAVTLSFIVAPLLGGFLAIRSYALPFWISCGLLGLGTLYVIFSFKETHPENLRIKGRYFEALFNLKEVVTNRRLRFYYWVNFSLYLAIYGYFRAYPIYIVDQYGLGPTGVGLYIAWAAVPILIANFWLVKFFSKRFGPGKIAIGAAILTGLSLIAIVIPKQQDWLLLTSFFAALSLSLCLPALVSLLSQHALESQQGTTMGNNQALQVAAEALSSFMSGVIATAMMRLPLIVWGLVAFLGAILLLFREGLRLNAKGR